MKSRREPDLSSHVVWLMSAVVEERAQKFRRLGIGWAGAVRAADAGLRQRAQDSIHAEVVQLEIFLRRSLPVVDVGLVPHFPQPGLYFGIAVALTQMMDKLKDDFRPLLIVLRRIGPAGVDRALGKIVTIRLGMSRQRFRHETDFNQRLDCPLRERLSKIRSRMVQL